MSFTADHISRTQTIQLAAPPSRVFPLFEPIGEQAWAIDWKPAFRFPATGAAQAGMVFTTQVHEDESESIWTITAYDPANLQLTYLRLTPGSRVGIIDIRCEAAQDSTTLASITYTFTALSEDGNEFLSRLTEAHYQEFIASWEKAINHYLASGRALPHH